MTQNKSKSVYTPGPGQSNKLDIFSGSQPTDTEEKEKEIEVPAAIIKSVNEIHNEQTVGMITSIKSAIVNDVEKEKQFQKIQKQLQILGNVFN